ncbi:hypothetical protein PHET_01636 [Paragonimus heterotremus]|uniref:Sodium/calcium exchanger membrane region domain-containing protein n=1 Tax=Paragonimus heterotremus TaxID=100268 RepID=A0A8J4TM21_9TREM|nr:hypothetical protein PHET_01636 [Paragonimus heterotremus]
MLNYSETYTHAPVSTSLDEHIPLCPSWLSVPGFELWPSWIKIALNIVALAYLFVGIAVTSEIFMFSIERITSTRRKVRSYDVESGMHVEREVFIWNETVANLTLMALGSSAPEILLACIEAIRSINNPPVETPDSLGLFTIIGSAAFNLFVISGICILTITSPFTKKIEKFGVFLLTSFFSLLSYGWMLVITILISPEIIELWEAILTFMFFPLMVIFAYAQDKDWWIRQGINLNSGTEKVKTTENASKEDKDKGMIAGEDEKLEEPVGLNHPEEPKGSLTESPEIIHKFRQMAMNRLSRLSQYLRRMSNDHGTILPGNQNLGHVYFSMPTYAVYVGTHEIVCPVLFQRYSMNRAPKKPETARLTQLIRALDRKQFAPQRRLYMRITYLMEHSTWATSYVLVQQSQVFTLNMLLAVS